MISVIIIFGITYHSSNKGHHNLFLILLHFECHRHTLLIHDLMIHDDLDLMVHDLMIHDDLDLMIHDDDDYASIPDDDDDVSMKFLFWGR